ncbi:hypothetical protein BCEP27_170005 [Burkholderia cepacia]
MRMWFVAFITCCSTDVKSPVKDALNSSGRSSSIFHASCHPCCCNQRSSASRRLTSAGVTENVSVPLAAGLPAPGNTTAATSLDAVPPGVPATEARSAAGALGAFDSPDAAAGAGFGAEASTCHPSASIELVTASGAAVAATLKAASATATIARARA